MAKLSSYYTLCPLIDQQSLLGVEKDADPACAIVTLGRNIVIRYKVRNAYTRYLNFNSIDSQFELSFRQYFPKYFPN